MMTKVMPVTTTDMTLACSKMLFRLTGERNRSESAAVVAQTATRASKGT